MAAGRHPVTENLGLENADIQLTDQGAIKVDPHLHTTVPNVWAIGDAKGGPQFTYISLDDFRIIKDELFGDGTRQTTNRGVVPTSVFIEPPLSQVGLTEKQAQAAGKDYQLFKLPVAAIPKAKVLKDQRGMLKMLVDPATKEIIGATIYALSHMRSLTWSPSQCGPSSHIPCCATRFTPTRRSAKASMIY